MYFPGPKFSSIPQLGNSATFSYYENAINIKNKFDFAL